MIPESEKKSERKIRRYFELNNNRNAIKSDFRDTAKSMLREKFTVLKAYNRNKEMLKINRLTLGG